MGKCYSRDQSTNGNSKRPRERRYRLVSGLLRRNGFSQKEGKYHKRGSEKVSSVQQTKKTSRKSRKSQRKSSPDEEIEIYPYKDDSGHSDENDEESTLRHFSQEIVKSDMNMNIPNLAKVVKIVVASVHEDMVEERLILEKEVYPELTRFCRKQGYDFVIVDLNIDDDQFKCKDWLEEINKAHNESTGLGFMVLVGQNFGERILPGILDVKDFDILSENIRSNQETLEKNYELSYVNQTACYVIKDEENDEGYYVKSSLLMEEIEKSNTKEQCEHPCVFNALLQVAALGQELTTDVSGALWIEKSPSRNFEIMEDKSVEDKKELKIIRDLYKKNRSSLVAYEEFMQQDKQNRAKFSQTVLQILKKKLQTALNQPDFTLEENLKEIAQHVKKCQENLENVDCEQEHVSNNITNITSYLKKSSKYPLVVHGAPGCGKSTIVAMAAKQASENSLVGTLLIVRFLGTTRHSSNLRFLLESICFQLAKVNENEDMKLPKDLLTLVKLFHNFLHNATKNKRVWIMLDGLDELPKTDLIWLPRELPDHVRIVLTSLTNGGCFNHLKAIVKDISNFINVGDLEKPHAISHVTAWYQSQKMESGDERVKRILDSVSKCPNLLYLNLVLHHYRKISLVEDKEYKPFHHIPNSLKHAIEHFFVTMETKHGKTVIGRIVGYLSAARYGLSESELQDILIRDRLSGQKNSSTLYIGSFQLARILDDFSPFFSKVYFDGTLIITWKHIIIRYLAFDRYLSYRQDATNCTYQTLANYFVNNCLTTDSDDDPLATLRSVHDLPHYLCKAGDMERLKHVALCNYKFLLAQLKATSVDYVIECFTAKNCPVDQDLKTLVDMLKMSCDALNIDPNQLAAQLIGRLSDLTSSDHLTRLLIEARRFSTNALIPNTACLNPPGTKLLHTSMELYGPVDLTSDGTLGISALKNVIALWDVRSTKIIRQASEELPVRRVLFCRNNRLIMSYTTKYLQIWETSTFKKIWRFECDKKVEDISLAGEANDVLIVTHGSIIKTWNLRNGQIMTTVIDEEMEVDRVSGWREYVACANSSKKDVHVYDILSSSFVTRIQAYAEDNEETVNLVLLSSFGDGQVLTSSKTSFDLKVFRLSNGEWLRTIGPDIVNPRLTHDGRYILSTNTRNDIGIWNMETGIKITNVFRHPPTSIITYIVANDLSKLVTLSDNKILRVWDLGKEETVQQSLSQEKDDNCIRNVMFIKSKGKQRQAVSRSKVSGDICVWNLSDCTAVRVLKGTQADDVLVVDETRAVLRSMGKLALVDLEEGRLIKKFRVSFPRMVSTSRMERRASSLYKRRNLSLRLLQRSGVKSNARCTQFTDVAIVGEKYVLVLTSKRNVLELISLDDGELVEKLDSGHKECVETILVSANGKTLICSYEKSPAAAWNLETRRVVGWLRVENAFPKLCDASITRDGRYLVDALKVNECLHLITWNIDIADVQCMIALPDTTVQAVTASSSSGVIVASLTKNYINTVMVYMLRSGTQLCSLPCGIRQQINNIHLNLDGKRAMTFTSGERSIRLWDITHGVQIGSFTADHTISDCALSDDGNHIVIAIYKASTIASLSFANQQHTKEMSVDVVNPYSKTENYGAVFEFINTLDWDDDTNNMDNRLAEKTIN